MRYIIVIIFLCLALLGGTDGYFTSISFAESDIEVMGTSPPEYEEDEPVAIDVTQDMIDEEEEMLEQKIREVNEAPVEEFGSLILQRKARAYYFHRLELLRDSPEEYFKTKQDK